MPDTASPTTAPPRPACPPDALLPSASPSSSPIFAHLSSKPFTRTALAALSIAPIYIFLPNPSHLTKSRPPLLSPLLPDIGLKKESALDPLLKATLPLPTMEHRQATLAARRHHPELTLSLADLVPRKDVRFAESLLFHKVIEDLDYTLNLHGNPSKATWAPERIPAGHMPTAHLSSPEASDFFAEAYLSTMDKPARDRPSAQRLFAATWRAEAQRAAAGEQERVLCVLLERYEDEIAPTAREKKILRWVRVRAMVSAGVADLLFADGERVGALVRREMERVRRGKERDGLRGGGVDGRERLVADLVSVYSEDVDVGYWGLESTLEVVMNKKQRVRIEAWIPGVSGKVHLDLGHGEVLEELEEEVDEGVDRGEEVWLRPPSGVTMLDWKGFFGGQVCGGEESGGEEELPEREKGFYSEMSGLSDVSISTIGAGSGSEASYDGSDGGEDGRDKEDQGRADSGLGWKVSSEN